MKEDKLNIIDEQDLFYYIFSPESISVEQKKIIKADKSFEDILEFYRQLKTDAENRPDDSIKRKIAEKIPAYSVLNTIRLYALKDAIVSNHKVNHLAAGSTELKQR